MADNRITGIEIAISAVTFHTCVTTIRGKMKVGTDSLSPERAEKRIAEARKAGLEINDRRAEGPIEIFKFKKLPGDAEAHARGKLVVRLTLERTARRVFDGDDADARANKRGQDFDEATAEVAKMDDATVASLLTK